MRLHLIAVIFSPYACRIFQLCVFCYSGHMLCQHPIAVAYGASGINSSSDPGSPLYEEVVSTADHIRVVLLECLLAERSTAWYRCFWPKSRPQFLG